MLYVLALSKSEEQPEYYENVDLETIVTPVKVDKFIQLLKETKYDPDEISFLKRGFCQGFDIGYEGPKIRRSTSNNIPFTI